MRIHLLLGLALSMQLTEQTFVFFGKFNKGKREGRKISYGKTSVNKLRSYGGYNHGSRRVKYQTRLRNKEAK